MKEKKNLLFEIFQEEPKRSHLSLILQEIKQHDQTGPKPPINGKSEMIDFLIQNFNVYYLFISNLEF